MAKEEKKKGIAPIPDLPEAFKLTEEHKQFIRENFKSYPDVNRLTRHLFGEKKDSRSLEGKLIRNFIVTEGLEAEKEEKKSLELNEEQKAMVDQLYSEGKGVSAISQHLFPEAPGGNFSYEWKAITAYLVERHDYKQVGSIKFSRPITIGDIVAKLNSLNIGKKIDPTKLTIVEKSQCESLLSSTSSERFKRTVEGYETRADRALFEDSFYRTTYDKPDLTVDEINLYITLCDGYVKAMTTKRHISKLNALFEQAEDSSEMSMKLIEAISSKNKELDEIEKRGGELIKKLNGDRSVRLKDRGAKTANLLALVTAFQSREERERMLKIAEMQRADIAKEIDRLETSSEFYARVVGLSKYSVL